MIQTTIAPATLLPIILAAVAEAGAMIRTEFHRAGGPMGAEEKDPIDREMEVMLKAKLLAALPSGWRGEERRAMAR